MIFETGFCCDGIFQENECTDDFNDGGIIDENLDEYVVDEVVDKDKNLSEKTSLIGTGCGGELF